MPGLPRAARRGPEASQSRGCQPAGNAAAAYCTIKGDGMVRLAMIPAVLLLAATAVWAQPGHDLMLELDLGGLPGVPRGVNGQIFVPVPANPPPLAASVPPPMGDVLHGPPGDVLHGPPGDPLTGRPPPSPDVIPP